MCCFPRWLPNQRIYVPCGQCLECMRHASTEWALRIMFEAKQYEKNCCVTLTYNDGNLPRNALLEPRDLQLWVKRLRKAISPATVRFFASGEYGEKRGRPHYHVILFGWQPDDMRYFFTRNGNDFFLSDFVQSTWAYQSIFGDFKYKNRTYAPLGNILVGQVDWSTAFYTAKYLQKSFKDVARPPFVRMSNRPGIGYGAIDFVNFDSYLEHPFVYFNGKRFSVPRYFWKKIEEFDPDFIDWQEWHAQRALASRDSVLRTTTEQIEARRKKDYDFFHDLHPV